MAIGSLPRRAYGVRPIPVAVAAVAALAAWLVLGTDIVVGGDDEDDVPVVVVEAAQPPDAAPPPEPPAVYPAVLVANRDLPAGILITTELVEWREWRTPVNLDMAVVEGAVPLRAVLGAVTRRPLPAGALVSWDGLLMPGHPGFISAVLAPGMRAVTVSVDRATIDAKIIYPGDHVDVIMVANARAGHDMAASRTIVRNTRVLAVGDTVLSLGRYGTVSLAKAGELEPPPPPEGSTFTLEVPPFDAERIAVALAVGQLTLAMRSVHAPQGFAAEERLVRLDDVMPPPARPAAVPRVRIFRGSGVATVGGADTPTGRGGRET